ncbi:DPBB-1 domain-containing protein [Mycena indigotica]|uniref:DPBB-1 domain-containing protein n=1 Tax=Mycena indigotica TaxID=2126181 RepID=A0A8H6S8P0_9AGAR|nr:DPBB-1 domain-containing protein [Mycena indigotica]KAF7294883.1 DPBB-1 domain-containing protein [Mycena indigotica]
MISLAFALLLTVASSSGHSLSARRHHARIAARATPPEGWATNYLEAYDDYHTRYLDIGCEGKHNTTFFDFCCHPLLATETLAKNRPACCAPGATAQCPSQTSGDSSNDNGDDDLEDCEDDQDSHNNQGQDDDGECEDEDDTPATTPPHTQATSKPISNPPHSQPPQATSKPPSNPPPKPTTSTPVKQTTTTPAESSTKTSTSSSNNNFITGGFGTWFTQGGVAGACGTVHQDTDLVVALPTKAYANGANCGRKVHIVDSSSGASAEAIVADECPTWQAQFFFASRRTLLMLNYYSTNDNCLDMSVSLFQKFVDLSVGEFSIKYQFLD